MMRSTLKTDPMWGNQKLWPDCRIKLRNYLYCNILSRRVFKLG